MDRLRLLWEQRRVTGQNGIGQNGTDKTVRTKRYGQNGSNFYGFQFNWIEFLFSIHKSQISDKPMGLSGSGINKENHIVSGSWIAWLIDYSFGTILSVPFCPLPFCPIEPKGVLGYYIHQLYAWRTTETALSDRSTLVKDNENEICWIHVQTFIREDDSDARDVLLLTIYKSETR